MKKPSVNAELASDSIRANCVSRLMAVAWLIRDARILECGARRGMNRWRPKATKAERAALAALQEQLGAGLMNPDDAEDAP